MNAPSLKPNPAAPDGFPFLENHLRVQLGWNKDEIRAARKTRLDPSDFTRFKKRVFLSAAGAAKLANGLAAPHRVKKGAAQPGSDADDPQAALRVLTVCARIVRNPRIVLACPEGENPDRPATVLRVRIRPGTQLVRRQIITGRLIPPYTDYYDLLMGRNGHPLPPPEKTAPPP